jgi:hypothetical protein
MTALFNCQNPVQAQGYLCVSVGDPLQLALTFGAMEMQDKDSQLFYLIYIRIAKNMFCLI